MVQWDACNNEQKWKLSLPVKKRDFAETTLEKVVFLSNREIFEGKFYSIFKLRNFKSVDDDVKSSRFDAVEKVSLIALSNNFFVLNDSFRCEIFNELFDQRRIVGDVNHRFLDDLTQFIENLLTFEYFFVRQISIRILEQRKLFSSRFSRPIDCLLASRPKQIFFVVFPWERQCSADFLVEKNIRPRKKTNDPKKLLHVKRRRRIQSTKILNRLEIQALKHFSTFSDRIFTASNFRKFQWKKVENRFSRRQISFSHFEDRPSLCFISKLNEFDFYFLASTFFSRHHFFFLSAFGFLTMNDELDQSLDQTFVFSWFSSSDILNFFLFHVAPNENFSRFISTWKNDLFLFSNSSLCRSIERCTEKRATFTFIHLWRYFMVLVDRVEWKFE